MVKIVTCTDNRFFMLIDFTFVFCNFLFIGAPVDELALNIVLRRIGYGVSNDANIL